MPSIVISAHNEAGFTVAIRAPGGSRRRHGGPRLDHCGQGLELRVEAAGTYIARNFQTGPSSIPRCAMS